MRRKFSIFISIYSFLFIWNLHYINVQEIVTLCHHRTFPKIHDVDMVSRFTYNSYFLSVTNLFICFYLLSSRFETLLFKLEVLDHKARERAGVITPTFGAPISVLLHLDSAAEVIDNLILDINYLY